MIQGLAPQRRKSLTPNQQNAEDWPSPSAKFVPLD
jgi:hypothetical protein